MTPINSILILTDQQVTYLYLTYTEAPAARAGSVYPDNTYSKKSTGSEMKP